MELANILARVERRLQKVGLSAAAASKLAGKPDAIRNLQRAVEAGGRQGVSTATLNALAPVLETHAIWLLAEAGPEELKPADHASGTDAPPELSIVGEAVQVKVTPRKAVYGGLVEAGSFRSVGEFADEDHVHETIWDYADKEFPSATLVYFDVVGDSMNSLKPRPLLAGDRVLCLNFESLKNRAPMRDGMVVVVEQRLKGGLLRERSVKQIELYRDRTEFCPRSSNTKHKPIVVRHEHDPDDGREVEILAIVRRLMTDVLI